MEKIKARSRLRQDTTSLTPPRQTLTVVKKPKFSQAHPRLVAYWHYIICLVIACLAYYGLFLLLNKVYPSQIQHFLWTNSYLPFFILLFLGNFFLLTFLFLDKKIGFYLSLWLNLAVYLKISQVEFDFYGISFLGLTAVALFLLIKSKQSSPKRF